MDFILRVREFTVNETLFASPGSIWTLKYSFVSFTSFLPTGCGRYATTNVITQLIEERQEANGAKVTEEFIYVSSEISMS
jgi:hypothetical protein